MLVYVYIKFLEEVNASHTLLTTKDEMKKILAEIQSGKFAKEYIDEYKAGNSNFDKMRSDGEKHPIESVGEELRSMMPWISANKLVDKNKN